MDSNDGRENRLEDKVDKIAEDIGEINVTLAKQHVSLEEHIRRTELLEERVKPLEHKYIELGGIIKFGGIIVAVISLAGALAEVMSYINHANK